MKKILLFLLPLLLLTGCSKNLSGFSFTPASSPFSIVSGVIQTFTSSNDFAIPNSSGSYASSTASLYCDVSKNTCYMANTSIGSLTLSNNILTPMTLRYASGSATSSDFIVDKDSDLHISTNSTTYPDQIVLTKTGNISASGHYDFSSEYNIGNSGTTKTIDFDNGGRQKMTMSGNCVVTLTPPDRPSTMILKVVQGASAYTINFATSSNAVYFASGVAPTLTTTAGAIDLVSLYFDGTAFWGVSSQNLLAL